MRHFARFGTICKFWKTWKTPMEECYFWWIYRLKPAVSQKVTLLDITCGFGHRKLRIWSHLQKKSSVENFIFCVVIGKRIEQELHNFLIYFLISSYLTDLNFNNLLTLTEKRPNVVSKSSVDFWKTAIKWFVLKFIFTKRHTLRLKFHLRKVYKRFFQGSLLIFTVRTLLGAPLDNCFEILIWNSLFNILLLQVK